jgi:hypothetical protein
VDFAVRYQFARTGEAADGDGRSDLLVLSYHGNGCNEAMLN